MRATVIIFDDDKDFFVKKTSLNLLRFYLGASFLTTGEKYEKFIANTQFSLWMLMPQWPQTKTWSSKRKKTKKKLLTVSKKASSAYNRLNKNFLCGFASDRSRADLHSQLWFNCRLFFNSQRFSFMPNTLAARSPELRGSKTAKPKISCKILTLI